MASLQAAAIALIALIVTPGVFFYFDVTPKIALLLLGMAAALFWPRDGGRAPRNFTLLTAAMLVSLAISTALSVNPALSAFGTNWRRFGAITQAAVLVFAWLVGRNVAGKPERSRTILRGIAAAGALTAVYGIAQYFGWDPLLPKSAYHIGEGIWSIVRPPGTLGYVSYFATWLLGVIFASLALAGWERSAAARRACYIAAGLAASAMLLTGTRAAILGLAAGFAIWIYARGFRLPRRVMVGLAAVSLAGAAFYFSPAGWPLRSRARWYREDPWGGARVHLWIDSAVMGTHRPLGYGPETFTATFPRFESVSLARAYPEFLHESPHNILLDAWVSQGILGAAALAGFCWIGMAGAWRGKQFWLASAIAAMVVSQMFTVFTMPTALVFYVLVAIAAGTAEIGRRKTEVGSQKIAFGARGAIAALLVYGAVRWMAADRNLELAKEALARGDLAAASASYGKSDRLRFPGSGSDLWYSRACVAAAGLAAAVPDRMNAMLQATAAAIRATHTSEEPVNAWYYLS